MWFPGRIPTHSLKLITQDSPQNCIGTTAGVAQGTSRACFNMIFSMSPVIIGHVPLSPRSHFSHTDFQNGWPVRTTQSSNKNAFLLTTTAFIHRKGKMLIVRWRNAPNASPQASVLHKSNKWFLKPCLWRTPDFFFPFLKNHYFLLLVRRWTALSPRPDVPFQNASYGTAFISKSFLWESSLAILPCASLSGEQTMTCLHFKLFWGGWHFSGGWSVCLPLSRAPRLSLQACIRMFPCLTAALPLIAATSFAVNTYALSAPDTVSA